MPADADNIEKAGDKIRRAVLKKRRATKVMLDKNATQQQRDDAFEAAMAANTLEFEAESLDPSHRAPEWALLA